jgi:hypothetical protein
MLLLKQNVPGHSVCIGLEGAICLTGKSPILVQQRLEGRRAQPAVRVRESDDRPLLWALLQCREPRLCLFSDVLFG